MVQVASKLKVEGWWDLLLVLPEVGRETVLLAAVVGWLCSCDLFFWMVKMILKMILIIVTYNGLVLQLDTTSHDQDSFDHDWVVP